VKGQLKSIEKQKGYAEKNRKQLATITLGERGSPGEEEVKMITTR
jgi:hypothetical protein